MPEQAVRPAIESRDLPPLARHLAHELNNPISAISSSAFLIQDFIETAEAGMLETSMIAPFIESIREECTRLKIIVEEFAKFITTESVLTMPLELSEFVRMRVGEMAKEGLPVSFVESSALTIQADAGTLQYVLRSIVTDAVSAGAKRISVAIESGDPCSVVFKDDRQIGVSDKDMQDMFQPIPIRKGTGLGLKLPLARRIVELHGGTVKAARSDEGLSVCIQLPSVS